jgi:Mce-associated membrane protein
MDEDDRADDGSANAGAAPAPPPGPGPTPGPQPKPSKAERLEAKAARLRAAEEQRAALAGLDPGRPAQQRGLIIATAALGAATLALAILLVLTFVAWQDAKDGAASTPATSGTPTLPGGPPASAAVSAAKAFALDFGSYDYQHLDTEFTEVAARMTPDFAKSYLQTSDRLKPTFVQYKTEVNASIQGFGITSSSATAAVVIVFLDQTVRTSQSSTPRVDRNRLEIHLVNTDGKWLVSKLLAK